MCEAMIAPLRRKLVALAIVTTLFFLAVFRFTYQRLSVDDIRAFVGASPFEGHIASKLLGSSPTTTRDDVQPTPGTNGSSKMTSSATFTPHPGTQHKILVVARTKEENTDWVYERLHDWPKAVYTVDDPSAALHTGKNKGHEASVYLTYIVGNYDSLPDVVVFIHSHQKHKHGTKRDRIFEGIDYDNLESIKALNLDFVKRNGFTNLRCLNNPGCPAEIQPFRPDAERDPLRPQENAMAGAWTDLFQDDNVPRVLAAPCCAQFAVSGLQIRQRPKAEYERFLIWVFNTPLDDFTSGRVFEYLWHVIFGKDPI
ncbi:hypothetical protein N0V83_007344 [Neocucurbitaria cava]|uniref:DUF3431 domain containing protein n=1 Tax=Neocucurbitaria cava TaxID=798079 RepID=A0A9W8Y331_9PLEO|nr:hypothetical protein N0V83_007344 [Neocucurbitaria cava]